MLLLEKWCTVLLMNEYNIGLTGINYKIRLTEPTPIILCIICYLLVLREALLEKLDKMKKADFIELSILPFAASMVCVKKGDSSLRAPIDFHIINKNIVYNSYPLHYIDDQIRSMCGSAWLMALDMTKGYH